MNVDIHDVDFNGVAKTSSILRYIQSAAQSQLTENGMSYDELKKNKRAFILSKLKLEITKPMRAYTPIVSTTYPCDSRGYSFLRCYSLECDGETVARAVSAWALVDTETRSLVRVNDFDLRLPTLPANDLTIGHISLPSILTDIGGYGVHYGDVDQNRHMNNTKYPDMYSSFLPLDGKWISSITISYLNEAVIGDKLRVQSAECDGHYYFRTVRGDGKVNSEAEITLSNIN
jgi:medium-chain acyl-[acyl-carrier-protein] hydrolase